MSKLPDVGDALRYVKAQGTNAAQSKARNETPSIKSTGKSTGKST